MKALTIAIDGPASAGKGTVARGVAEQLGYQYIDTGAMYRSVALKSIREGIGWSDEPALVELTNRLNFAFEFEGGALRIRVNDRDVTQAIRNDQIGMGASMVSSLPGVRTALLARQRALGAEGGIVMDGRDIGTVVLPDAELKIYLDADLDIRARRRHEELHRRGETLTLDQVRRSLAKRDAADMQRDVAPLRAADDAVRLDSTDWTVGRAVQEVLTLARERGA